MLALSAPSGFQSPASIPALLSGPRSALPRVTQTSTHRRAEDGRQGTDVGALKCRLVGRKGRAADLTSQPCPLSASLLASGPASSALPVRTSGHRGPCPIGAAERSGLSVGGNTSYRPADVSAVCKASARLQPPQASRFQLLVCGSAVPSVSSLPDRSPLFPHPSAS